MLNAIRSFWTNQKQVFSPFVIQLLLIMFLVEFVKGAILISILPVYMKSVLGISAIIIGWTMAIQYIGDNAFRGPIGWMIDKIGYRPVMLTGVLMTFLSLLILIFFSHFSWILVAVAFLGVGTSPLWPCVITGATEKGGDSQNGTMMSVIYLAWLSGIGLGPVVINFFISDTYVGAFRLLLVLIGISVIISLFLPSSERGGFRQLRKLWQTRAAAQGELAPFNQRMNAKWADWKARSSLYIAEVRASLHVSWLFYPALFAQTFAIGLLTPVLTIYARTVLELTPEQYSLFLVVGGAITVVFLIPVGKLVDRFGYKGFVHAGLVVSSVSLLIFTYVDGLALLLIMVGALGVGYALLIPSWNALIASVIPKEKRGAVWGFFLTIEGAGTVIGPIISGILSDSIGYHAPFIASGCVLAVLFVLQLFIFIGRKVVVR
ncbi:MFS transporter [Paenibacillus koleovorans]|uniref:MFS transporter n=1 Tax=Paenibacillus koleovorans TaxID=121608 RepID=UPI000FDCD424|nr:MFS transporter [Paenibacillus koleovorans]